MPKQSKGEAEFWLLMLSGETGLPRPIPEYPFHPDRKWRLDFAWPDKKVGLEIEGGTWTKGGHRGAGKAWLDMEKFNWAAIMGWKILRVTPDMVGSNEIIDMLQEVLL